MRNIFIVIAFLLSSVLYAEHNFEVNPDYTGYNFSTIRMGIYFYPSEPSINIEGNSSETITKTNFPSTLKKAVIEHFNKHTLLLETQFVSLSYDPKEITLLTTSKIGNKISGSNTFKIPADPSQTYRETGFSTILIIEHFSSGGNSYIREDHSQMLNQSSEDIKKSFNPSMRAYVSGNYEIKFSFWYTLFDLLNEKVIQHGYVENIDKAHSVTIDDWNQSLIRCFDDIIADGPLNLR
jgi:hypothetical protein